MSRFARDHLLFNTTSNSISDSSASNNNNSDPIAQDSSYNTTSSSPAFGINTSAINDTDRDESRSPNVGSASYPSHRDEPRSSTVVSTSYPSYFLTSRFLNNSTPSSINRGPRMPRSPQQHHSPHQGTGSDGSVYHSGHNSVYYGENSDRYNSHSNYYIPSGSVHSHGSSGTQSKTVCRMDCRYCSAVVCLRGMKAMLLADTTVELYSTDHPPGSVQLIEKDYTTSNCKCKIRDVACRVCGNIIGYHITQPCQQCLKAPNNGHFWMFHTEGVIGQERLSMDLGKLVHKLISLPRSQPQQFPAPPTNNNDVRSIDNRVTEASTTRQTSISRQQQHSSDPVTPTPSSPIPSSIRTESDTNLSEITNDSSYVSESGLPLGTASATLASLSIARFLQPMKWEQLPHPDLDIDLDPNTMGGEPLFAQQWTEMVLKTAEAAAVNMSLALDQEEETERFLEKVVEEQKLILEDSNSEDEEEQPNVDNVEDDNDSLSEVEETQDSTTAEVTMEQLIDQVDEFRLVSSSSSSAHQSEDHKDEDCHDVHIDDMNDERSNRRSNHRQQESQPDDAPAPGQQEPLSPSHNIAAPALSNNNNVREDLRQRRGSTSSDISHTSSLDICPAFALNSATIAKAAASAAAADAASAANSLLYGRRIRRDYDMMCR